MRTMTRAFRLWLLCALVSAVVVQAPGVAVAAYPANYNPLEIISVENWRAGTSMSQAEIQAFLETQNGVLKAYSCAEGGPAGLHSQVVKPASQIIAEAAAYYSVNPKLIIATLEKEQSLISQPWHTGRDIDPSATHLYSTEYHLTNAMGAGVYSGSTDRHPGFGDQVWTGTRLLGSEPAPGSTSAYAWYPGKTIDVYSYETGTMVTIAPLNQPTWNAYTYTPYYPQISVWQQYNKFFGDPLAYPGKAPVYRFYNRVTGSHFYTRSEAERYSVITNYAAAYTFEGPAYSIDASSAANASPLHRFYNKKNGTHFYTASESEKHDVIEALGATYVYEGVAYNISLTPEGCVPVYRFYNRRNASHFYTISEDERQSVIANLSSTYTFEGVAYYVALSR